MNNVNIVGDLLKLRHNKEAEFTPKSNDLPIQAISISLNKYTLFLEVVFSNFTFLRDILEFVVRETK